MTKCTVFGSSGYIGRNLLSYLKLLGYDVFAPDRKMLINPNHSLGHVFYCIGLTADFRSRPFDTIRAHVTVLADILENADFESFLYLSSTRVYQSSNSANEDTKLNVNPEDPSDLYNISKVLGEAVCMALKSKKVRIARLSNVLGRHDEDSDNFVPSLFREAKSGKVTLRTSMSSSKDYIHIDDVVYLLERIALTGNSSIYNVASGYNLSHRAIVKKLLESYDCDIEISHGANTISFPVINVSRIHEEFGFRPRYILDFL